MLRTCLTSVRSRHCTILQRLRRGQSLAEIIVAVGIAGILAGTAGASIATVLRSDVQSKRLQAATTLAQELSDGVRSFAEAGWTNIYNLNHGSGNPYYLNATSSPFTATAGTETVTQEGVAYTRSFYVENVSRDLCGAGSITSAATTNCASGPNTTGVATDPSTQLVTIVVTWPESTAGFQISEYLTRSRNQSYRQTDWSGGGSQEGPITAVNGQFASSTSINSTGTQGSIQLSGSAPYPASGNLYSSVFDTGVTGGVALNTVLWQGSQPTGTSVLFQIGSSNCSNGATNPPTCTTGTWAYSISGQTGLPRRTIRQAARIPPRCRTRPTTRTSATSATRSSCNQTAATRRRRVSTTW